jgi:hypothetical protein
LAGRDPGEHALDQVGGGLGHAPPRTRWTKPPMLATKGQEDLFLAGITSQAQKAMDEDAP